MDTAIFYIEPGIGIRFWLLLVVGLVVGLIVYKVMTDPRARRAQFQDMGTFSKGTSAGCAVAVMALVAGLALLMVGGGFHKVVRDGDRIVVHYPRFKGAKRVERRKVKLVTAVYAGKRSYQVVIKLKDGGELRSLTSNRRWIRKQLARLRKGIERGE